MLLQEPMGAHENLDAYLYHPQNLFGLFDNVHVPLTRKSGIEDKLEFIYNSEIEKQLFWKVRASVQ